MTIRCNFLVLKKREAPLPLYQAIVSILILLIVSLLRLQNVH
jgi:hypothetical protein